MKLSEFIKKLQNLPEKQKLIIIFSVVIIIGLPLGFFWVKSAINSISKIGNSLQSINLPKIDVPQDATNSLSDIKNKIDNKSKLAVDSSLQTADWKTYTNTEYGFEMKYPENVIVKQEGNIVIVYDTRQGYPFDWNISLYQNNKKMDLADWINFQFNSFGQGSDKDCKIVSADKYGTKINIKDSYTLLVDAPSYEALCSRVGFYTISPDKLTVIGFNFVQASPELYQDILSTFKFTN